MQSTPNANVHEMRVMHTKLYYVYFVVRMDVLEKAHNILVVEYQRFS